MFQSLLAERFGLRYHFESRATGTYASVVAKGGPKLKEAGRVEGGYHYKYPGMTMQNCASFLNQGTFDLPVVGPHSPPATTPAN